MSRGRFILLSMSVGVLCLGCSAGPAVDQVAEEERIRELDRRWQATFAEQDVSAAMQFFASDAVLMPPNRAAIVGRESIQAWFETWLPNPAVSTTFAPVVVEVAASGDIAYERGTFEFTMESPEGRVRDAGKYLVVWRKIDGEWKAILDMSNSDLESPEITPVHDPDEG